VKLVVAITQTAVQFTAKMIKSQSSFEAAMRTPMFSKWDLVRMKFSLLAKVWQRGYTWEYRWYRLKEFFGLTPDWTPEEQETYNNIFGYHHPLDTACLTCGECRYCNYCICHDNQ